MDGEDVEYVPVWIDEGDYLEDMGYSPYDFEPGFMEDFDVAPVSFVSWGRRRRAGRWGRPGRWGWGR